MSEVTDRSHGLQSMRTKPSKWTPCTATSKQSGERCKRRPHPGASVCVIHGAGAPHVKLAARERLASLVHPAITALQNALNSGDERCVLVAAKDLLDRAGYGAPSQPTTDTAPQPPTSGDLAALVEEYQRVAQTRAGRPLGVAEHGLLALLAQTLALARAEGKKAKDIDSVADSISAIVRALHISLGLDAEQLSTTEPEPQAPRMLVHRILDVDGSVLEQSETPIVSGGGLRSITRQIVSPRIVGIDHRLVRPGAITGIVEQIVDPPAWSEDDDPTPAPVAPESSGHSVHLPEPEGREDVMHTHNLPDRITGKVTKDELRSLLRAQVMGGNP